MVPWIVACQTSLSMGFTKQEYWSRLPFSSPGNLPDCGFCTTEPLNNWGSPTVQHTAASAAKSLQSCPTLCNPIPGIPQARTLEWVAIKVKSESEVAQSCLTLHDPIDCSLPGSSIHGIFQARVLEWGAIAFSNNSA